MFDMEYFEWWYHIGQWHAVISGYYTKNALDSLIAENANNDPSQPLDDYASWDKEQSYPDVGNDDQDEIMNALKEKVKEAISNGMSSQYSKKY